MVSAVLLPGCLGLDIATAYVPSQVENLQQVENLTLPASQTQANNSAVNDLLPDTTENLLVNKEKKRIKKNRFQNFRRRFFRRPKLSRIRLRRQNIRNPKQRPQRFQKLRRQISNNRFFRRPKIRRQNTRNQRFRIFRRRVSVRISPEI
ncbi:MAG: hypothetical protein ACHBN1_34780 [Heteroscytonema crispum UTEX LB 1556]